MLGSFGLLKPLFFSSRRLDLHVRYPRYASKLHLQLGKSSQVQKHLILATQKILSDVEVEISLQTHTDTHAFVPLEKTWHVLSCALQHLLYRFFGLQRNEKTEQEKETKRDGEWGSNQSPTGANNNLKDSGLCVSCPTKLLVDLSVAAYIKNTPFYSEIMQQNRPIHT